MKTQFQQPTYDHSSRYASICQDHLTAVAQPFSGIAAHKSLSYLAISVLFIHTELLILRSTAGVVTPAALES
jgi:hypothetical protein